jgi:hypothetical protein
MPSFASKVRGNADLKAAARGLGMKPKQVQSRSDMNKVRQEAKDRAEAATSKSQSPALPAPVGAPGGQSYANVTTGGNAFGSGMGILGDIASKWGSNEIIGGEVVGSLINAGQGLANVGLADLYTRNTLATLGEYNAGEDRRRTGNLKDLMTTEAALNSQTIRDTGAEQRKGYVTQGEQERLAIGETGLQQRLGYQEQGRQERQNLTQKGLEERKMRADARGAIRSQGARFYG